MIGEGRGWIFDTEDSRHDLILSRRHCNTVIPESKICTRTDMNWALLRDSGSQLRPVIIMGSTAYWKCVALEMMYIEHSRSGTGPALLLWEPLYFKEP